MADNSTHVIGIDRLREQLALANILAQEMSELKSLRKKVALAERIAQSRARIASAIESQRAVRWPED